MQEGTILAFFGEDTKRFYKLFKTKNYNCLEFSGIRMHCTKQGVKESTIAMVNELEPLKGICLDCCCGLGYTAIEMAKKPKVEKVFVFENDHHVIEIAKINPHSKELFSNKKIILKNESVYDAIKEFPDEYFDRILHDPPRFALAPELYSTSFYKELFRVLKKNGKIFHYTGFPGRKKGEDFQGNTMKRMAKVGFSRLERREKAQGISGIKE